MKLAVTVEDMAPAIHMGTSVDVETMVFDMPEDVAAYISKNKQSGMTTVIRLSVVQEKQA
jgi:hypothetical protein